MKRAWRRLMRGVVVLCVIVFTAWLLKDSIFRALAERRLRDEAGLTIAIGQLKVGFSPATVALKEVTALNPPRFGPANWLHVREVSGVLDTQQARTNQLHFRELKFHLGDLTVIKNTDGLLNIEVIKESVLAHLRSGNKTRLNFSFGGIDKLDLTLDHVNYIDEQQPANSLQLDLGIQNEIVTDLRTEADFNQWANAFVIRVALKEYLKNPKLNALKFLWAPPAGDQR